MSFLEIFLLVNVFVIGGLCVLAAQYAYAHFRPHEPAKAHPTKQSVQLPPAVKEKLLLAAESNFQKMLDHSATELQKDLKVTTGQMNEQLQRLGADIINDEMKRYKASLDELRAQTEITIGGAQTEVKAHQADLEAKFAVRQAEMESKLQEEMTAEKQRLMQQIDTRLADAVASFLLDTLQHNADLGAQSAYLTAMLDEHKDDFKREVGDETTTAK